MKLPNAEKAVIDIEKLRNYCLSARHPRGRHKARVFLSVLGLNDSDAVFLRDVLARAAVQEEAVLMEADQYGERYVIDLLLTKGERSARVRSSWMVRSGEDFPRLTSCYIL